MTQDFAKIRPEPILERQLVEAPPAWSLMLTGGVVGLAVGVFACFMFYLSGNVPPLNGISNIAQSVAATDLVREPIEEVANQTVELEFYNALPEYEVEVDATPVPLTQEQAEAEAKAAADTDDASYTAPEAATGFVLQVDQALSTSYILQSGAFERQELAQAEMRHQQALGLQVAVKRQEPPGRLYFLQSGPYTTRNQLRSAEQLLRSNNISSMRMRPK